MMKLTSRNSSGLTLMELLISLLLLSILISIGIASYSGIFSQQALIQRTERVYHFLRLAKSQAVKLNQKVYVKFCESGSDLGWRMAMSEQSNCDCYSANACLIDGNEVMEELADGKTIFTSSSDVTFINDQVSYSPMRFGINPGSVTLSSVNGEKLKVIQSTMRLKICSPDQSQLGYKKC